MTDVMTYVDSDSDPRDASVDGHIGASIGNTANVKASNSHRKPERMSIRRLFCLSVKMMTDVMTHVDSLSDWGHSWIKRHVGASIGNAANVVPSKSHREPDAHHYHHKLVIHLRDTFVCFEVGRC